MDISSSRLFPRAVLWGMLLVMGAGSFSPGEVLAQKGKPGKEKPPKGRDSEPEGDDEEESPFRAPLRGKPGRDTELRNELENQVQQAQELHAEQDYEAALELLDKVLKADPQHAVGLYQRASARVEWGRIQNDRALIRLGLADARQALALAGNKYLIFHIPYFYGMTSLAEMEQRPEHADVTIKVGEALLHRPDLGSNERCMTYYQLGLAYAAKKEFTNSAKRQASALEIDPEFFSAHLALAQVYEASGDLNKARAAIDATVKAFPEEPMVYNNRGTLFLRMDKIPDALRDFDKALSLEPEFAMAWFNRGYAHSLNQEWSEALVDYDKSLELDDSFPMAWRQYGFAFLARGNAKGAMEAFNNAVRLGENDGDNYAERGCGRVIAGEFGPAAEDLTKALQMKPHYTLLHAWRYIARAQAGQKELADQELAAFLKGKTAGNFDVMLAKQVAGQATAEELLKSAVHPDEKAQAAQICLAEFFLGVQAELNKNADEAKAHYAASVKTGQTRLPAFIGAQLGLQPPVNEP